MESLLKKLVKVEKRLLLTILLVFGALLIFNSKQTPANDFKDSNLLESKIRFFNAKSQIKDGHNWQPQGTGETGDIATLPQITSGAVMNLENGQVIWSKNLKEKVKPASLSKLATVITALDIAYLGKLIAVSPLASEQIPTKLGLVAGEKLTLEEAISAAVLTSANDATEAIADSLGSEMGNGAETFMELVNIKLQKIGAYDSHFTNATGLDNQNHYSTVYDLLILASEVKTNYPFIADIASDDYIRLEPTEFRKLYDLPNWNALLGTYPGVNGLKIGYTEEAGHVTIVTAKREGKELTAIVIGAKSIEDREIAAATLLNYGFEKSGIDSYPVEDLNLVERFEDWRRQLSQGGP